MIFGSSRGSIGTITQIPDRTFKILTLLEQAMDKNLQSPCHLSRSAFRSFKTDSLSQPAANFIDGDFVEQFLTLD
jgi:CPSF A subunit region